MEKNIKVHITEFLGNVNNSQGPPVVYSTVYSCYFWHINWTFWKELDYQLTIRYALLVVN